MGHRLKAWLLRVAIVFSAAVILLLAGVFVWAHDADARGRRFATAGVAISKELDRLSKAVLDGNVQGLAQLVRPAARSHPWQFVARESDLGFDYSTFESLKRTSEDRAGVVRLFADWRKSIGRLDKTAFRLLRLRDLVSEREADIDVRFEIRGLSHEGRPLVDQGVLKMRFERDEERWQVSELSLKEGYRIVGPGDYFVDVAAQRGLDFILHPDPRAENGAMRLRFELAKFAYSGMAAGDFNGDGYDDLFFGSGDEAALYVNRGDGTFADATEPAGLSGLRHVTSAIFADFDNDGDSDLYVGVFMGANQLFRNDGDGTFTNVTEQSGLGVDTFTAAAAVGDLDNDGLLDIYVAQYLDVENHIPEQRLYARNGEPNRLYLNLGGLSFADHTEASGAGDRGLGLSLAIADYDNDGDQDIYVVNDFGRNVLLRNRGDATFEDVARRTNTLAVGAGMSAQWADYNSDGLLDLYVTGIRSDMTWYVQPTSIRRAMALSLKKFPPRGGNLSVQWDLFRNLRMKWDRVGEMATGGNYLLRNDGDGTFSDVSASAHVQGQGWYWSAAMFDFDNDTDLDLYAVNGFISQDPDQDLGWDVDLEAFARPHEEGYTFSMKYVGGKSLNGYEHNTMHVNDGRGQFTERAAALGLDSLRDGRGLAISDFDHDGDLDIVVNNYGAHPNYFVNQRGNSQRWLQVRVVGRDNNRDGIGALVKARTGTQWQTRLIAAGEGYASQYSRVAHFGLGDRKIVDELQVWWPNGERQTFYNLPSNHWVTIDEDQSAAATSTTGLPR